MINFSIFPFSVTDKEEFTEASGEELRILLALIEAGGRINSESELASLAKTSKSRAAAALVFWEGAGVIKKGEPTEHQFSTITEEFEERIELGKITERTSGEVAREIRDNNLAALISEIAAMMQKPALSTEETKIISALYTQYSLGEEYIITLAAYILESKGKLTAQRLGAEAERLIKRGVDCTEELEKYITEKENESGAEWEFKRIIGIYNRNLTKKEQELVKKWYYDFGFGESIIGEAYDITVMNTSKLSLPYMDKLITHWHAEGCKTKDDCTLLMEREKAEKSEEKKTAAPPKLPRKKETPRYGDFDVNDAFEKALLRSYGEDESSK